LFVLETCIVLVFHSEFVIFSFLAVFVFVDENHTDQGSQNRVHSMSVLYFCQMFITRFLAPNNKHCGKISLSRLAKYNWSMPVMHFVLLF